MSERRPLTCGCVQCICGDEEPCHGCGARYCKTHRPAPVPEAPRATREEIERLRLAYAHACERMGMAHATGTRAEWEAAADDEVTTRAALLAAFDRLAAPAPAEERPAAPARDACLWHIDCAAVDAAHRPGFPVAHYQRTTAPSPEDRAELPVCARHPDAPHRLFGELNRCSECGEPGTLLKTPRAPSPEDTGATAPHGNAWFTDAQGGACPACAGDARAIHIYRSCAPAPGSPSPAAPGSDEADNDATREG